jgi:hypothetical protein
MAKASRNVVLASPIVVILIGLVVALISRQTLDPSIAWLPPMIAYWLSLFLAIVLLRGIDAYRTWLQPSQGHWGYRLISLLNVLFILMPSLIFGRAIVLNNIGLVIVWLMIVLLNPVVEEGYWRATLIDAMEGSPRWMGILNSAFWFGLSHPLIIGINIALVAGITGFIGTFINGVIWAITYSFSRSLRWGIATHIAANVFSIAIFLGLLQLQF